MHFPAVVASTRRGTSGIVIDAFYGFVLSADIVFVFRGVSSWREYVLRLPHEPDRGEGREVLEMMLDNDDNVPQDVQGDDANANVHG